MEKPFKQEEFNFSVTGALPSLILKKENKGPELPTGLRAWKLLPYVHIIHFLAAGMEGLREFRGY